MKFFVTILFLFMFCAEKAQSIFTSDATKHYEAGQIITGFVATSVNYATNKPALSVILGVASGIGASLFKELVYDRVWHKGVYNTSDWVHGTQGSLAGGFSLVSVFNHYKKKRKK